jgi:hypothetical protein
MGNDYNYTAACLFLNSDIVMSSCRIINYKAGAIFSVSDKEGQTVI